jgi:DNA-directed RNA polymerase alpha subunit
MSETLVKGYWCEGCGFFEPYKSISDPCESCGCPANVHKRAKVVVDDDDEQLIEWELDLPIKVYSALKRSGIETMGELREIINADPKDFNARTLYDLRNIGVKSADQIKDQFRRWEERG